MGTRFLHTTISLQILTQLSPISLAQLGFCATYWSVWANAMASLLLSRRRTSRILDIPLIHLTGDVKLPIFVILIVLANYYAVRASVEQGSRLTRSYIPRVLASWLTSMCRFPLAGGEATVIFRPVRIVISPIRRRRNEWITFG